MRSLIQYYFLRYTIVRKKKQENQLPEKEADMTKLSINPLRNVGHRFTFPSGIAVTVHDYAKAHKRNPLGKQMTSHKYVSTQGAR